MTKKKKNPNSGNAWQEVKASGQLFFLQANALRAVIDHPNKTAREMTKALGHDDPATIRRRLSELEKIGLIRQTGSRLCDVTNRKGKTYEPVPTPKHDLWKAALKLNGANDLQPKAKKSAESS